MYLLCPSNKGQRVPLLAYNVYMYACMDSIHCAIETLTITAVFPPQIFFYFLNFAALNQYFHRVYTESPFELSRSYREKVRHCSTSTYLIYKLMKLQELLIQNATCSTCLIDWDK